MSKEIKQFFLKVSQHLPVSKKGFKKFIKDSSNAPNINERCLQLNREIKLLESYEYTLQRLLQNKMEEDLNEDSPNNKLLTFLIETETKPVVEELWDDLSARDNSISDEDKTGFIDGFTIIIGTLSAYLTKEKVIPFKNILEKDPDRLTKLRRVLKQITDKKIYQKGLDCFIASYRYLILDKQLIEAYRQEIITFLDLIYEDPAPGPGVA